MIEAIADLLFEYQQDRVENIEFDFNNKSQSVSILPDMCKDEIQCCLAEIYFS